MMKRFCFLLAAALLAALFAPAALGEVVSPRDLDYAYIRPEQAYIVTGEEAAFTVEMSADPNDYVYTWTLYVREDLAKEEIVPVQTVKDTREHRFAATVDKPGHYVVRVEVMSPDYHTKRLGTGMIVAATREDEGDPNTAAGKVVALIREMDEKNLASDYEKALWLHDWLIYNADYDESMLIHEPAGVLCRASGVCESYALAYQMLLDAARIPVLYVTGYAGGESHAWNLVKLDDEWYHIDCTWDDPKGGGNEGYGYFGLSDELMQRDHNWEVQDFIAPRATGTRYNYLLSHGAATFDSPEDMDRMLSRAAEEKTPSILFYYTGSEKYFDAIWETEQWLKSNMSRHLISSYSLHGSRFSGTVTLEYAEGQEGALPFESAEEMAQQLEKALAGKTEKVSLHYRGTDRMFFLSSELKKWLSANSRRLYVTDYQYSYTDATADIQLKYGDFTGYAMVATPEELDALLAEWAAAKKTEWKIYYTGEDEWFSPGKAVNQFLGSHPEIQPEGGYGAYSVDVTVTYR